MQKIISWFAFVALICQTFDLVTAGNETKTPKREYNTRIVGGHLVPDEKELFFLASLQDYGYGHFCGGSLIHEKWVLTAAHCVADLGVDYVSLGSHNNKQGTKINVKRIITHSGYNDWTMKNDIALLELEEAATGFKIIPLADSDNIAKPGDDLDVAGWGSKKYGQNIVSQLREVTVPYVSREQCTAPGSYQKSEIFDSNICAGYVNGGYDSCQGDSGSALYKVHEVNGKTKHVQMGVVSWGVNCAAAKKYGVYTKVSSFTSWIRSKTKGADIQFIKSLDELDDDDDDDDDNDGVDPSTNAPDGDDDDEEVTSPPLSEVVRCGRRRRRRGCRRTKRCVWAPELAADFKCVPETLAGRKADPSDDISDEEYFENLQSGVYDDEDSYDSEEEKGGDENSNSSSLSFVTPLLAGLAAGIVLTALVAFVVVRRKNQSDGSSTAKTTQGGETQLSTHPSFNV